jgi:hypothetical protein
MRVAFDPDRLVEALQARLEGDRKLARRIVDRMLELERQRDQAQHDYREANRQLHRLDLNCGPYAGMSTRKKLAVRFIITRAILGATLNTRARGCARLAAGVTAQ